MFAECGAGPHALARILAAVASGAGVAPTKQMAPTSNDKRRQG
jgi:hypothetical protein